MRAMVWIGIVGSIIVGGAVRAAAEDVNVLFLSTSEQFAHGPIVRQNDQPSVATQVLTQVAQQQMGLNLTSTKDASRINAETLKNFKLVLFYTQGDLTKPNKEGAPPMGPTGVAELVAWIEQGGGFVGFHSATDTFDTDGPDATPYIQMIGGEFAGHGGQFVGTLRVIDPQHPTMKHVPQEWKLNDEWYMFRKFNKEAIRVLALLDPGEERTKQEMYNVPSFPVVWCRALGKGRVYYTALAHREDVWTNPTFQEYLRDVIEWALGRSPASAEPNFDAVVPTTKPEPPKPEGATPAQPAPAPVPEPAPPAPAPPPAPPAQPAPAPAPESK